MHSYHSQVPIQFKIEVLQLELLLHFIICNTSAALFDNYQTLFAFFCEAILYFKPYY